MTKSNNQANIEIIDFVKQTTIAINTISEATKGLEQTTGAIKEMINQQNVNNATAHETLSGKMDALQTMFKYAIVPLVAGILALAGIKQVFNL